MARKRLKDYKPKVVEVLREQEKARNNDSTLIAHFIFKHARQFVVKDLDGKWCVRLQDLQHLPSFETIRRNRQIIQNDDGLYLPTDPLVRKSREIKEADWRNWEVREAQNTPVE